MLKILAGTAKGRSLKTPENPRVVRPILGRIKKSLFDILTPRLPNSRFLDLYAGTGAVGLEALSRGVAHATFVERDPLCLKFLQANISHLGFDKQSSVVRANITENLSFLPGPFTLIFMGPPYKAEDKTPLALVHPTLDSIAKNNLLAPAGIVIAQHHKKEAVASTPQWNIVRQEHYGDSTVTFFKSIENVHG
jgi:16S rRNA (guanine(966)-N(2))-methyltransferase RsmD